FAAVRWLAWALLWVPTRLLGGFQRAAERRYIPLLGWALAHRATVVVAAALVFAGAMLLVPRLGTELIPQLAQGEFSVDLRLAPGAPLIETDRIIRAAQRATQDIDTIELTYSVAG